MGDFAVDTAIEGGDGRYRATLSRDWEIWGPNGGYVAAIALRAAGAASRFARPASFSAQFLSAARFEEVQIKVEVLRATRVADALLVRLDQGDRPILTALVWTVDEVDGLVHDVAPLADVPGPSEVPSVDARTAEGAGDRPSFVFWENLESRPLTWIEKFEDREPSEPVVRGWYRYRPRATFDDPFVDAARGLLLIDTMGWPAAVRAHAEPLGVIAEPGPRCAVPPARAVVRVPLRRGDGTGRRRRADRRRDQGVVRVGPPARVRRRAAALPPFHPGGTDEVVPAQTSCSSVTAYSSV